MELLAIRSVCKDYKPPNFRLFNYKQGFTFNLFLILFYTLYVI